MKNIWGEKRSFRKKFQLSTKYSIAHKSGKEKHYFGNFKSLHNVLSPFGENGKIIIEKGK